MLWNYVNLILGILLLIFPGCVKYKGPGYTPNINLTKTSPSIPLKIDSRPLVDSSPPADKESGYMTGSGSSATSKETLKGDLATLITTLLRGEFQRSNLFEAIDSDLPTPDLVLSARFTASTNAPRSRSLAFFVDSLRVSLACHFSLKKEQSILNLRFHLQTEKL
jgi:hypothetical protein